MGDDMPYATWFAALQQEIEEWYLVSDNPYRQSGYDGTPAQWRARRELILHAVSRNGTFLDIGCANGFLLECLMLWAQERQIDLIPYGIDLSPRLIALARQRLPAFATHFEVANAFTWVPPMQYDYVHTRLEYVPSQEHQPYLQRLLDQAVAPDGHLIINGKRIHNQRGQLVEVATYLPELGFALAGSILGQEQGEEEPVYITWIKKEVT